MELKVFVKEQLLFRIHSHTPKKLTSSFFSLKSVLIHVFLKKQKTKNNLAAFKPVHNNNSPPALLILPIYPLEGYIESKDVLLLLQELVAME